MSILPGRSVGSNELRSEAEKRFNEAVRAVTRLGNLGAEFGLRLNPSNKTVEIERRGSAPSVAATKLAAPAPAQNGAKANRWRSTLAVVAGGFVVFLVAVLFTVMWISGLLKGHNEARPLWPHSVGPARVDYADQRRATLSVAEPAAQRIGQAVPLGVTVLDLNEGGLVVVRGMVNGTILSAGKSLNGTDWWLSTADLGDVVVQPPPHFIGTMEIAIELRLANTALSDRRTLRVQWEAATAPEAKAPEAKPVIQPVHPLPPGEVSALIKRGEELVANRDFSAARLVLRRAADAGNARAALALAKVYDPKMLEKIAVHGPSPDPAMARHWYEKAKEFGLSDDQQRLELAGH